MERRNWETYLSEVLSFVKFRYDHRRIRRELEEHMEDLYEEFLAEGMEKDAAESMAVQCMGDAEEIGKALNQEHGAIVGWIWQISRILVVFLLCITISPLWNFADSVISNTLEQYEPQSESREVWRMKLDRAYAVYADTLLLEDLHYYADGRLTVVYRTKYNPFGKTIPWGHGIEITVRNGMGAELGGSGGGYKKGGYNGIGWRNINEIPPDAKELEIRYGELRVWVDLETGEVRDNEKTKA